MFKGINIIKFKGETAVILDDQPHISLIEKIRNARTMNPSATWPIKKEAAYRFFSGGYRNYLPLLGTDKPKDRPWQEQSKLVVLEDVHFKRWMKTSSVFIVCSGPEIFARMQTIGEHELIFKGTFGDKGEVNWALSGPVWPKGNHILEDAQVLPDGSIKEDGLIFPGLVRTINPMYRKQIDPGRFAEFASETFSSHPNKARVMADCMAWLRTHANEYSTVHEKMQMTVDFLKFIRKLRTDGPGTIGGLWNFGEEKSRDKAIVSEMKRLRLESIEADAAAESSEIDTGFL